MTHPIDTAYVDIVPVDKSMENLNRYIEQEMKRIEKNLQKDLKKIDKDFDDTFSQIDRHFADMNKDATKRFRELEDIVDDSLGDVTAQFDQSFSVINRNFTEMGNNSRGIFSRIKSRFLEPMRKGLENLGEVAMGVGRGIAQIVSGIGGAIGSNPLVALILVLTPALIALAAALSQLIGLVGLVPAGFAVMLTAIIPVVVAFQNFGEAVSALAEGDLEKINEALKKLSPSAAAVAREVAGLLPQMRAFQRLVQEAFFAPLRGTIAKTMREIFPTMEKGFVTVAGAVGQLVKAFAGLAAEKSTIETFQNLFATTGRIINKLTGPLTRVTDMLLNMVNRALPFIERLSDTFGRLLDKFSAWVNKKIETGEFDKFIDDAIITMKELIDLVKAVGGLIGTIFAGTEGAGHDFLKTLTDMVIRLDEFLKTAEGKAALDTLVFMVQALGVTLMSTLEILIFFWKTMLNTFAFLEMVGRGFVDFVSLIIEWGAKLWANLSTDFENVVNFLTELPNTIMGLGPKFLQAGRDLIESFMRGFRIAGGFIADVAGDIVAAVKGVINRAIDRVNAGIKIVDDVTPGSLGRIPRLAEGGLVKRRPGGILANIGEGNEDEIVAPLSKLEGMISGGPSITFGAGAISVNFSGVVPTEREAQATGKAVGQGILDMITKRNMRAQVRAV